jgi:hypothetical protein
MLTSNIGSHHATSIAELPDGMPTFRSMITKSSIYQEKPTYPQTSYPVPQTQTRVKMTTRGSQYSQAKSLSIQYK